MDMIITSNWDKERMGRLETLYREGLSFTLIAADIGVTRSAAIGKARRMQLPKRIEVYSVRAEAVAHHPKKRSRIAKAIAVNKPDVVPDPDRDYRCTIYELEDRSCRYPLWSNRDAHPARLYCGIPSASVAAGTPYCPHHMILCGTPPK